jgi:hypothetical protein
VRARRDAQTKEATGYLGPVASQFVAEAVT